VSGGEAARALGALTQAANVRGNVSAAEWLAAAAPSVCAAGGLKRAPCVRWQLSPASRRGKRAVAAAERVVRAAGPAASLALAIVVSRAYAASSPAGGAAAAAAAAAPWLVLACGVVSDLLCAASALRARALLFSFSLFPKTRCARRGALTRRAPRAPPPPPRAQPRASSAAESTHARSTLLRLPRTHPPAPAHTHTLADTLTHTRAARAPQLRLPGARG
jgi:hypothetical protein